MRFPWNQRDVNDVVGTRSVSTAPGRNTPGDCGRVPPPRAYRRDDRFSRALNPCPGDGRVDSRVARPELVATRPPSLAHPRNSLTATVVTVKRRSTEVLNPPGASVDGVRTRTSVVGCGLALGRSGTLAAAGYAASSGETSERSHTRPGSPRRDLTQSRSFGATRRSPLRASSPAPRESLAGRGRRWRVTHSREEGARS